MREGADQRYSLVVPFLDAAQGGTQRLSLPDGGSLDVDIPAGLDSGQTLRLRGKGGPGEPPGDALIAIEVGPHPYFRRLARDIHAELPVGLAEAVLGAQVTVPTISGSVAMTIPSNSDTDTRLRLRGKGVPASGDHPAGDAYVTLRVVLGSARRGSRGLPARADGCNGLGPARKIGGVLMITMNAVIVTLAGLDRAEVERWIEQDWVRPVGSQGTWLFSDIDVARLRLIRDLRDDLGLQQDALSVVLRLLDQLTTRDGACID